MAIGESTSRRPAQNGGEGAARRRRSLLAGMRIRKKLVFLHTLFTLFLTAILVGLLRPAVSGVVRQAEWAEADVLLAQGRARLERAGADGPGAAEIIAELSGELPEGISIRLGAAAEVDDASGAELAAAPLDPRRLPDGRSVAQVTIDGSERVLVASVRLEGARQAVARLYVILTVAVLVMYALVVVALEVFVLPKHVYGPIRRLLRADRAVHEGQREDELIDDEDMPADELGEIMRSRNEAIVSIRRHERDLAAALGQLEQTATDMKRKNHLLEMAKRNLADADRLASLGMMSAGIAHELNTPLSVLKGLVERLEQDPKRGVTDSEAALMLRVVNRLERLSESLLDFARVRAPEARPTDVRALVDEAWTLVRLDREARNVEFVADVAPDVIVRWDADRMLQVLVNLLRNAVDAMEGSGSVRVAADPSEREGSAWLSVTVSDTGPGLDPELMSRLFEPFVSTRLDSRGTGLGLAVAEGIVREHGGVLLARNRDDGTGAVFECMLPVEATAQPGVLADHRQGTPASETSEPVDSAPRAQDATPQSAPSEHE